MRRRLVVPLALLAVALLPRLAHAQRVSADGAAQTFRGLTEQFFDTQFRFNPTSGTQAGFHQYDAELEDASAANIKAQVLAYRGIEAKLAALDPKALDRADADDLAVLLNTVRSALLTLEVIKPWQTNPDSYSSGITGSAFTLMSRNFAPPDARLRSLVARERKMPAVLDAARKNLVNPPRISTEIALEQIDGLADFFANDVPAAFADAHDAKVKADFAQSNAAVIAALKSYGAWLRSDLLPRSKGEFRLGTEVFRKKLALDEMVDTPLDRLLAIAMADLRHNQAEFARVAKEIDPTKTPAEVLAELATIHPAPDKLLDAFHAQFASLIAYIRAHRIVTIPSDVEPTLEETPPFMRATTQASMDSPGAYETHSTKAYFNVTLPEPGWSPQRVAEHMAAFNVGTIVSTSVHEAYPGHYVQFLYSPGLTSKVRKLTFAATDVEGWAHYCEQMMLDQGYAAAPAGATPAQVREAKLIRLGQLQDALLRDARFVVSIRMHTEGMSTDDAEKFFVAEGYQSPAIGRMETKRGTSDAMYLYYTLGKLEIMKLRADVQAKQGAGFSLERFHDDFLKQGPVPVKIIRRAMLGDDSPAL